MNTEFIAICVGFALTSVILSAIAITVAGICWAKVVGLQNSTHQVQYMPIEEVQTDPKTGEPVPSNTGEALDKQMAEAFGASNHEGEYV